MRRAVQGFYKRFSGHERAPVSDRQGADARRDATSGKFVCFQCPGAGALDPVIRVRILVAQRTVCGAAASNWARLAGFSVATNEKAPQAKSLLDLIVTSH